jgi:tape measure domain-containing protein
MVRENVDIVFRESGIRVIKRRLDDLGESANRATRGIFLLQRALFVIGGFGIANALASQADALTNLENRLRLTTNSAVELQQVQTELFNVARRSRADLDGVAQSYTRTALSAKAFGRSQQEVLKFTESVTKAAVLSGASTREINASLIQLGQGIASNRLGGDELRSILEQLPLVADIIAKELGVTRGELRELGSEGKITGTVILDAFKNASDEIDRLFANTQPTIEQAFAVAKTNLAEFIDTFDDATGASAALANAIIAVSANMDTLLRSATLLAGLLAISFAGSALNSALAYINVLREGSVRMVAALNRLVAIRTATLAKAQAQVAANAVAQAEISQNLVLIAQGKTLAQQAIVQAELNVADARTTAAKTGNYFGLIKAKENLARITATVNALELTEKAQAAQLAAARGAQAGATNALAGAQGRLAGAQAAQAGTLAAFTGRFPLLAAVVRMAAGAVSSLWALLMSNPLTAVIGFIAALTLGIALFGDKIEFVSLGFVTLKDLAVASLELIYEAIAPLTGPIWDTVSEAASDAGSAISSGISSALPAITQFVVDTINAFTFLPRAVIAIVAGINAAWGSIPAAAGAAIDKLTDMFATGMEFIANLGIKAVNKIIEAFNGLAGTSVGELLGIEAADLIPEATFDGLRTSFGGSGAEAGDAFVTAFNDSMQATKIESIVGSISSAVLKRAQDNAATARADRILAEKGAEKAAADAAAATADLGGAGGADGGGGGGGTSKSFMDLIDAMKQQVEILKLSNREREIANGILNMEKELKRQLTDQERELAVQTLLAVEAAKVQGEVLDKIVGPQEDAIERLAALNTLFEEGRISVLQYKNEIYAMTAALNEASGTLIGGFKSSIQDAIMNTSELGKAIGSQLVSFVNSASDAIVEFAQTGELNIRELFSELFSNLLKLASQQLLLKLLSGLMGGVGGGVGGGGFLSGLLGMATGGSILPSGPGSTDSQIVAFKKRPDERVDVLTPQQQRMQAQAGGGGGTQVIEPQVTVKIFNEDDPGRAVAAIGSDAGTRAIMNVIRRNPDQIKAMLR